VSVYLDITGGKVLSCSIRGDFLAVEPIETLERLLEGIAYEHKSFSKALNKTPLPPYLGSISKNELLAVMFDL